MTPEQYQRVTEIFNQVIESPSDQQAGLLSALCAGDDTLRREVESLLRVHPSAQSFIEEPFRASGLEDLEDLPTEQAVLQTQSFFHLDTGQQARGTSVSDRYVVERELGRGGNGIVYLARDQQLHGRLVVVKVLLENQQGEPLAQRMFESESEALARISHPGVVKVLDRGRLLSGQSYFVMEYVRGETLRAVMQRRRLSLAEVAGVVSQIGRALSAAHREGVYHRDLKPENVMLEDLGDEALHVKLIDFGIAKVANSAVKQDGPDGLVGTLPYMAPEQILASGCSAATDIYALGIIAYELLAGERPYKPAQSNLRSAIQSMTTLQRAGFGQHLRQRRPDLDEEVEQVLRKALAYDAGQRYASAEDFVQAFLHALELSAKQEASLRAVEEEPTISLSNLPPAGEAATLDESAIPTSTTTAETPPPAPSPRERALERMAVTAGVLVLLIAAGSALLWWWDAPTKGKMTAAAGAPSLPAPPAAASALTCNIELVTPGSPQQGAGFLRPEEVVPPGKDIVFHLTPHQSGYLYLFAPSNGQLSAFRVPDEPSAVGYPLVFPKDASIGLARTAATRFTLVLSGARLTVFDGLRPGQALSAAQQRELATLVERFAPKAQVIIEDTQRQIRVPPGTDPAVCEVIVRH
ncbi:serine/threonine-protein kinase [Chloracidobacterium aggregatum]|uniref:Serine/threonine protein kinase n=1 Tax=Chloracidobacterium sp. N TaxID=2821540 RepID=A0ABX8B2R6_9BACT|nr:serine/threonine-protein kinase [Chloracidobacterium aggregatum]QUV86390.1 serine/threonine protein kinase [Chloracidobacterium sp. 2]QUV89180.1 serine/threonine protein kinase [Chloracidobacterium sp. S]QUV92015.1 serine/threonine protein kinase [Chloracidobacterium sp. A]QUV95289.1 serine/threonine protein kinase [Chloracidobacterium sp. N]